MPELPEVETTRRGVQPYLEGHSITSILVRNKQLRWEVPQQVISLKNEPVIKVERRAKYLFLKLKKGTVIIHLGMSGSLRIAEAKTELRKHDHVIFSLSTGKELRFHDPRRFGSVLFASNPSEHRLISSLGVEPLESSFSADVLHSAFQRSKSNIKQGVMNAKIVVGVGNIYASEALFLAKIHPLTPAKNLNKKQLKLLVKVIKAVLTEAIEKGGTTLRDFVNQNGNPGYFQQKLHVYNQASKPCKLCSSKIERIVIAQRSTFFCPNCQPLAAAQELNPN